MGLIELLKNLVVFILHVSNADSFPPALSKKEEQILLYRLKDGDIKAKDELISHNLRLVAHIIKKYYANYSDQDDLISIGTIGLIKAVNTFDPDKGTKLATYAARCIENEILMYFRSLKKTAQEISFNDPIDTDGEGNPLTLMDIISSDDDLVDDINRNNNIDKAMKIIEKIHNQRDKAIIVKRYGLNGKRPKTQKEIAEEFKISRSYVSRIEKRILEEIARELR